VKRLEEDRTSPGGIVIPDTAAEKNPFKERVVAVGKGKILENATSASLRRQGRRQDSLRKYSGTE